ncbi:uncharacterized protein atf7ip2 [Pholidichthys leucotaenia]
MSYSSSSVEPKGLKIKIFKSKVQKLIEREVSSAVNETKIQELIESIQQQDNEIDYGSAIQKLETRINTLSKRAEAALAYMIKTQKKSPLFSIVNVDVMGGDQEGESTEKSCEDKRSKNCVAEVGEIFEIMEKTKKAAIKMRADNTALTATIADLIEEQHMDQKKAPKRSHEDSVDSNKEQPSSDTGPNSRHNHEDCGLVIKEESDDWQENNSHNKVLNESGEQQAKKVKEECCSPQKNDLEHKGDKKQDKPLYPPLPPIMFPSNLAKEAELYCPPQKVKVNMAIVRNPPGLSLMWTVSEIDPSAPPMDSYFVCLTMEKVKGSGVFPDWQILHEVKAVEFPMCVLVKKYKPGHKLCAVVVGKDVFGRFGPYSDVATAVIPN